MRLRECRDCTLLWADARPPLELIEQHFESAYKDRDYFEAQRHRIFKHLADVISPLVPPGGAVLDVGGAQGDLMAHLEKHRSDVRCVVSDVSSSALEYAASAYGLEVRHGTLGDLATAGERYDVLVCSDALYYEADLRGFWRALRRVLRVGGSFVLRLPNRRWLIDLAQSEPARRLRRSTSPECTVPFFNPEHLYVFGREFLQRTLAGLGFQEIRFRPSPFLMPRGSRLQQQLCGVALRGCAALHRLTGLLATPATVVVARGFR